MRDRIIAVIEELSKEPVVGAVKLGTVVVSMARVSGVEMTVTQFENVPLRVSDQKRNLLSTAIITTTS